MWAGDAGLWAKPALSPPQKLNYWLLLRSHQNKFRGGFSAIFRVFVRERRETSGYDTFWNFGYVFLARKKTLRFYWNSNFKSSRMGLHDQGLSSYLSHIQAKAFAIHRKEKEAHSGNSECVRKWGAWASFAFAGPPPHRQHRRDTHSGERPCPTVLQTALTATKRHCPQTRQQRSDS